MNQELEARYSELQKELQEVTQKFQKESQDILKKSFVEFFNNNEEVKSILWVQYTPYWNDGEECVFRVGDVYFSNASEQDDLDQLSPWGEYEGDNEDIWERCAYDLNKDAQWLDKFLSGSDMKEVMKSTFGDHVKIIATKEGFDVQEYDHD